MAEYGVFRIVCVFCVDVVTFCVGESQWDGMG